jgi:DNA-directed RNA polymerase specialized sigma24 family protein
MSVLDTLYLKNSIWLEMALKITKSEEKSKDLVQDMYLRIGIKKPPPIKTTSAYIFTVMKNIFLDQDRKNNTYVDSGERERVFFIQLESNINTDEL